MADRSEPFTCGHTRRITIAGQCAECTVYPPPRRAPGLPTDGLAYADADMLGCFSNWLAEMAMYGEPLSSLRRRVGAILEAWGFDTSEPIVPIDLQAPVQLVEVDFQSDPDDGIGRTLELREALRRQEGRGA